MSPQTCETSENLTPVVFGLIKMSFWVQIRSASNFEKKKAVSKFGGGGGGEFFTLKLSAGEIPKSRNLIVITFLVGFSRTDAGNLYAAENQI